MTLITTIDAMQECFQSQKQAYAVNPYPSISERKTQLKKLKKLMIENQREIAAAMAQDFGCRNETESIMLDILTSVGQINYTLGRLKNWMKPERRSIGMMFFPAKAEVHYQPLGVVGVVTPWNYPVFLSMGPLIAAFAAGNRAMIKMSEFTPHTNKKIAELLSGSFSSDEVAIVEGEVDISVAFSKLTFDHILFTGSGNVGKSILREAAEELVPVTLELGGKSPCILTDNYSVKTFVKNFMLSKTLNSGQTCVAPDTLFCHRKQLDELIAALKSSYQGYFNESNREQDITSVINDRQWQRMKHLLSDAESKGAQVEPLSEGYNEDRRQMPTTLVLNTTDDMQISQEEIFGPLLPIVVFDKLSDVIKQVNAQPRPLALYIFSNNIDEQRQVLYHTHSGGACVNDAAFHVGVDDLPFGGVGASGMGSYHGEEGFKTFSHAKSVLIRGKINLTPLFGPPYGRKLHDLIIKFFMR